MKIISWNVNGLKSIIEKGFLEEIIAQDPDILCLQEVKSTEIPEIENYISYNYPASELVNFYGTAIYTKVEPLSVRKGFGDKEFDAEGRVIRMEFENFYLYNVYCPSGASSQERLDRKFRFYDEFTEYVYKSNKPSIICGDFNRISAEIDAKNPKNIKGKSGFLPEEQEWFKEILTKYADAFRKFHKDGDNFTWWPNRKGYREDNKGYRFDYFLVSNTFENTLTDSYILKDQMGSDHAPIVLELNSCPVCGTVNNNDNEFCYQCGIKIIETEEEEEVREDKLEIPKDKIILLDLNYTLIANSKEIFNYPLEKKIKSQKYEMDLIELIKDNYVILITASPYKRSHKILRDIKEKTGFQPDESYWNFGGQPPQVKKYWMENEVIPQHGDEVEKYLAIESNPNTRRMYKKLGIEARPKGDFI
ncbi:exodeoxyribonuclease III [Methanobrevibacter sp.]|uniref:exodeoxyribonuclease III n=1 Tax=Methanobrevibacter sp. TaxID=66852 RepID=UPI003868EDD3